MHNTHKTHNKYNITSRLSQGGLSAVSKDLLVSYFRCMKHYHIIYYIIYHTYYILYKNIIYVTYIYMYMYVYVYVYVYIYVFVYVYVCIYIYIYIYTYQTKPSQAEGWAAGFLCLPCAPSPCRTPLRQRGADIRSAESWRHANAGTGRQGLEPVIKITFE